MSYFSWMFVSRRWMPSWSLPSSSRQPANSSSIRSSKRLDYVRFGSSDCSTQIQKVTWHGSSSTKRWVTGQVRTLGWIVKTMFFFVTLPYWHEYILRMDLESLVSHQRCCYTCFLALISCFFAARYESNWICYIDLAFFGYCDRSFSGWRSSAIDWDKSHMTSGSSSSSSSSDGWSATTMMSLCK